MHRTAALKHQYFMQSNYITTFIGKNKIDKCISSFLELVGLMMPVNKYNNKSDEKCGHASIRKQTLRRKI